jgi:DNA-binding transcriptional regulator YiaG
MTVEQLIERARFWKSIPPEERKRIRINAGVSLRETAEAIGVTHATINNWERGHTFPQTDEHDHAYRQLLDGLRAINNGEPPSS